MHIRVFLLCTTSVLTRLTNSLKIGSKDFMDNSIGLKTFQSREINGIMLCFIKFDRNVEIDDHMILE